MSALRLLVFGARPHSLGWTLAHQADEAGLEVETAGISGEGIPCDAEYTDRVREALDHAKPDVVVCTIGVNAPARTDSKDYFGSMERSLAANLYAPMRVVRESIRADVEAVAVVSSNSASIPRSNSGPYCASKAALSMALRVAAREGAREANWPLIYGYEFGLLAGTPMTDATAASLPPGTPLSRMPGAEEGLDVAEAACTILAGLLRPWPGMNGMLLRYDAGEL